MKKVIYALSVIFYVILTAPGGYAQKNRIDSLKNIVKISRPDTNKVKTLNALAFALRISDLAAAEKFRKDALALSTRLKYASGIAWGYYLEGVLFTYQNKMMRSVNSLTLALDLANKAKDYELVGRVYNGLGLNNLRLEDDYNAIKAFENALAAIRKAADKSFESAILHNIGSLYVKNKRFNEAIKTLTQSIGINVLRNNKTGLALNFKEMALAHYGLEDYHKALEYADKSLALSRETDFLLNEINSLSVLGMTYLKLGRFESAKVSLDQAYIKAIPGNPQREKLLIYGGYADYYSILGNFREALKFQNRYAALYDSIYSVGRSKLILEYQEKFLAHQKEAENKGLRIDQMSTQNQIREKNRILQGITVVLILFVIFTTLIFWGNARIRRANKLLLTQKNEIGKQKDNVDQLNTIKDKLFSLIAHDLRTPFASLKSMMDMYDEGMISKEDVSYFFKEIRRDIGSNTILLDNLLIWAKSQLGGFKVDKKVLAMERVVDEIIYYYTQILESKQITVVNELNDACVVEADYEMTKTIVRNLIGNAIKYTPVNGRIVIAFIKAGGEIQVSVTDNGIGMTAEVKEQLFQETFFTTQGLNNERGTGLGLQICKEFIEKNGGTIGVETQQPTGSSFWFTLPESKAGVEVAVSASGVDELEKQSLNELISIARLKNKYDSYELLLKASNNTIWDWDLSTNEVTWNEAIHSNFGYDVEKTTLEWWAEKIDPNDYESSVRVIHTAIDNKDRMFEMEYPFKCANNSYKYVLDRGLIIYENGQATRLLGMMHNLDSNRSAMSEIKRLSLVATNVNNLVVITNTDGAIVWVNHAFENLTGYSLNEVAGEDLNTLLSGPETSIDAIELAAGSMVKKVNFEAEIINYRKTGEPYWVHVNSTPYTDPVSGQMGYISVHTIVNERKTNERQMVEQNEALREIARITSHEVRSPLSSILGLVKIIRNNPESSERQECINLLQESATQLDVLIHRINNHLIEIDKQEYQDA